MAVVKRTLTKYGRRRYYRNGYRRYRSLSNQYFRVRIEGVYTIAFPSNTGDPVFAEVNQKSVSFWSIFGSSRHYGSLTEMFGYYKITGVAMEVIPGPKNFEGTSTVGAKTLVGIQFGIADSSNVGYHNLVADNNSILLGVLTKSRKYVSAMGSVGWMPCSSSTEVVDVGRFAVASSITGTLTSQPTWTCKLILYMVFKKSMV